MTTYNTRNPLGSTAVKDLYDNAENLDHLVNDESRDVWDDRFGQERKTWAGIEKQAQLDIAQAVAEGTQAAESYRDEAQAARNDAVAASGAIGPIEFYDTYAQALAAAAGPRRLVEISRDETLVGARTRYWADASALEFVVNLDQVRMDLASASEGATLVGFKPTGLELPSTTVQEVLDKISGVDIQGQANDIGNVRIVRRANYVGGTPGFVNAGLRLDSYVAPTATAFEWGIVGVIHNYALSGENVGVYGQGNQHGNGGTWGGVMEALDHTFTDSTGKKGLVGLEVDCYFNGEDVSKTRIGLMVIAGDAYKNRNGAPGTPGTAAYGIIVLPQDGGASCQFLNGVVIQSATDTAFQAGSTGIRAFRATGEYQIGIDFSEAIIHTAAIRIKEGQSICFDVSGTHQFFNDGTGLAYQVSGDKKSRLNFNGGIALNDLRTEISGGFTTGTASAVLSANKPGVSDAVAQWLDVKIDGQQYWIPAWNN